MLDGLGIIVYGGIVSFILLVGLGCYTIYDKFVKDHHTLESHHKVIPSYKLHTDGKTVDTIYVYKF